MEFIGTGVVFIYTPGYSVDSLYLENLLWKIYFDYPILFYFLFFRILISHIIPPVLFFFLILSALLSLSLIYLLYHLEFINPVLLNF